MIRLYFLSFCLLFPPLLRAQSTDSLGLDDYPFLTRYESDYLNNVLKDKKDTFDFTGKKVAYVTGKECQHIISKSTYFKAIKAGVRTWPDILTPEEKVLSGGYDVLLLHGAIKICTPKRKCKILKELRIGFL
jgi:hypothetical protein